MKFGIRFLCRTQLESTFRNLYAANIENVSYSKLNVPGIIFVSAREAYDFLFPEKSDSLITFSFIPKCINNDRE